MIYFTSDLHLGHNNIIDYCKRPFKDIEEMNCKIISNWNNIIAEKDKVYILGDFAFKSKGPVVNFFKSLNGEKVLIVGNHDGKDVIKACKELKIPTYDYLELHIDDDEMDGLQKIVLFHYPIKYWNKRQAGSWHLHGHMHYHNNKEADLGTLDVGVDANNFKPISYEQVKIQITQNFLKK